MTGQTDLIKRLRMLAPPNPVGRLVLTGDDWEEVSQIIADVERWNALLSCARIRILGWAGFNEDSPSRADSPNYRHFGAEFWTQHTASANEPSDAHLTLIRFADAARADAAKVAR